jgi:hypothetical protein
MNSWDFKPYHTRPRAQRGLADEAKERREAKGDLYQFHGDLKNSLGVGFKL